MCLISVQNLKEIHLGEGWFSWLRVVVNRLKVVVNLCKEALGSPCITWREYIPQRRVSPSCAIGQSILMCVVHPVSVLLCLWGYNLRLDGQQVNNCSLIITMLASWCTCVLGMTIAYSVVIVCCELIDLLITSVVFVHTTVRSTTRSSACHCKGFQALPLTSWSGGGAYEYSNPSDQKWERNSKVPSWLCLVALWRRCALVGSVLIIVSPIVICQ